jgi:hypothetical protein
MSIAAIGPRDLVDGYGLAGALRYPATDPEGILAAWQALPADAELLLLSRLAAAVLAPHLDRRPIVWVEVPE